MTDRGYFYVADGADYVAEARRSAESLRRVDPEAAVTLLTSQGIGDPHPFDVIRLRSGAELGLPDGDLGSAPKGAGHQYVILALCDGLPYQRTVFLDSDTHVVRDPSPIHELLHHCDVAVAPAPNGFFEGHPEIDGRPVRAAEIYNTGVIGLARNRRVQQMLELWRDRHGARLEQGRWRWETDQRTFVEALLLSECRLHVLSARWNLRTPFFSSFSGPVHIVHGREDGDAELGEVLNRTWLNRAWDPNHRQVRVFDPSRHDRDLGS